MSPTRRVSLLAMSVGLLALAATRLPLATLPERVDRLGPLAPVVGVVVGALLLMALLPRTAVSLACGLLFGAPLGAACALAVTLAAATLTFAVGRWLGRDFITRHAGRRWDRIEGWVQREGVLAIAAVRALPLGPYGLLGYAYGASAVRARHYVLGCLIAGTPSAIVYPMIGAAAAGAGRVSAIAAIPLSFGLLLSVALALRARRASRSQRVKGSL